MKIINIVIVLVIFIFKSKAQINADAFWFCGYYGNTYQTLKFVNGVRSVDTFSKRRTCYLDNSSLSDTLGNMIFFSTGTVIYNKDMEIMENGKGLNPGKTYNDWFPLYPVVQGMLSFKMPNNGNLIQVIHVDSNEPTDKLPVSYALHLYSTVISIKDNDGLGRVIEKNKIIYDKIIKGGSLSACRHANGRDWWVVVLGYDNPEILVFLLDPSGIKLHHVDTGNTKFDPAFSTALFSPDGTKWAHHGFHKNPLWPNPENYPEVVHVFDFDRCSGRFSNHRFWEFTVPDFNGATGTAISPNSRFLYISTGTYLFQYDLNASNIQTSGILVDYIDYNDPKPPYYPNYYLGQLAQDGKIYYCSNFGSKSMNMIMYPDSAGIACKPMQDGLPLLIFNQINMPYFPNFNLGPMPGALCDSLRTDNINSTYSKTFNYLYDNKSNRIIIEDGNVKFAKMKINIYDIHGHEISNLFLTSNSRYIDMPSLSSGIYIINFIVDNIKFHSGKIVVLD